PPRPLNMPGLAHETPDRFRLPIMGQIGVGGFVNGCVTPRTAVGLVGGPGERLILVLGGPAQELAVGDSSRGAVVELGPEPWVSPEFRTIKGTSLAPSCS